MRADTSKLLDLALRRGGSSYLFAGVGCADYCGLKTGSWKGPGCFDVYGSFFYFILKLHGINKFII